MLLRNNKVQRLLIDNNIQQDNYSLVLNLKKMIEELRHKLAQKDKIIEQYKRDTKSTKINQMEIQIQHLNDQNKRLLLIVDEMKGKAKHSVITSSKKGFFQKKKEESRLPFVTQYKVESKMSDVLKENENLRRQLLAVKVGETFIKKRKNGINDRNSICIEKNIVDFEKLQQKKIDLQAQKVLMIEKINKLQNKINKLEDRNQQLEKVHYKHLQLSNYGQ